MHDNVIVSKMRVCKNGDIMRVRITCSVYRDLSRHIVFLYITNFWPGMNNTMFLIVLWMCVNGDRLTIL